MISELPGDQGGLILFRQAVQHCRQSLQLCRQAVQAVQHCPQSGLQLRRKTVQAVQAVPRRKNSSCLRLLLHQWSTWRDWWWSFALVALVLHRRGTALAFGSALGRL